MIAKLMMTASAKAPPVVLRNVMLAEPAVWLAIQQL
jgi:hypothetical protein